MRKIRLLKINIIEENIIPIHLPKRRQKVEFTRG